MAQDDWDIYFIRLAMEVAKKSKDPSTKVGCIIVGPDNEIRSTGYNGFPRGVRELEGGPHTPKKIDRMLHGGIQVTCICGSIFQVGPGGRVNNWDIISVKSPEEDMLDRVLQNEHFQPRAPELSSRWERPTKYDFVEHAERNAVYNAARVGVPLKGCRAYLNWEPYPCKECAKAFIQAGIVEVIGPDIDFPNHTKPPEPDEEKRDTGDTWKFTVSRELMDEAGVTYRKIPWPSDAPE